MNRLTYGKFVMRFSRKIVVLHKYYGKDEEVNRTANITQLFMTKYYVMQKISHCCIYKPPPVLFLLIKGIIDMYRYVSRELKPLER